MNFRGTAKGDSTMSKCRNCYRYVEKTKNIIRSIGIYSKKPRKGAEVRGTAVQCHDPMTANSKGCEYYEPRWVNNIKTWWTWHFKRTIGEYWRVFVRVPLGSRRKPVPINWIDRYNGLTDTITSHIEPRCPRCGEMPYSIEQCVFCGQRFTDYERMKEGQDNESDYHTATLREP